MINIAIDGFSGVGKSTLTRLIAKKMDCGIRVLDTGAIFRGFSYAFMKTGKDINEKNISQFLKETNLEVVFEGDAQKIVVNGEDVTPFIRTQEVGHVSAQISKFSEVRKRYLQIAQAFAQNNNCVMEGRDIGTVVMPFAQVKIFLTADVAIRAQRRYDELVSKGEKITYDEVLKDLKFRDKSDLERKEGALKMTSESIVVDNSEMTLDETANYCCEIIKKALSENNKINITIDGYVCSGKSTIARALAKKLGFKVFDTGAIYRGIACAFDYMKCDQNNINEKTVEAFSRQISVTINFEDNVQHVLVNGIDYTPYLRTEEISALSAKISPYSCIREKVLNLQRSFARDNDLVMEGRDIGSFVLPNAEFKFFCTADEMVRAKRRFEQQRALGNDVNFEDVLNELRERDYKDVHRDHGAIKILPTSIIVDTTNMSLEESVDFCINEIKKKYPNIKTY